MAKTPLDPPVSDTAPVEPVLTGYDEQHLVTYLRLLDADADGADWREVAKVVLHIDPDREPERARRAWEKSSRPRQMDDRERLSPSSARRRTKLTIGCLHVPQSSLRRESLTKQRSVVHPALSKEGV